jgi:hypothetical protein
MMQTPAEIRPESFSRRGEITAWVLEILTLVSWFALQVRGYPVPKFFIFLTTFLLISALAISLSNWSDRHTLLRLEADGVHFENGLRRVDLSWNEIQKVHIFPSNLGDRVRVTGDRKFFTFRLLGEVSLRGQVRGRMGFADGERILRHILQATGLKRFDKPGEGYYYARE